MRRNILTICVVLASFANKGFAEGFDWKRFIGEYDFVGCKNNGNPVWGDPDHIHDRYVLIFRDQSPSSLNKNNLHMNLRRKTPAPFGLGWSLELINQGIYKARNRQTRVITGTKETFTDATGLSSFYHWDWRDGNSGWTQLRLELDQNHLNYEMSVYRSGSRALEKETCRLVRRAN